VAIVTTARGVCLVDCGSSCADDLSDHLGGICWVLMRQKSHTEPVWPLWLVGGVAVNTRPKG
jgi:hypothetical protein